MILFYFCISFNVYSDVTFSAATGLGTMGTKSLLDRSGLASGTSLNLKIGYYVHDFEVGMYNSSSKYTISISHDDVNNDLSYSLATFGAYLAYYFRRFVLEIGYGKSTIKEEIKSDLSASSVAIITDLYNIHSEPISASEARVSLGFALIRSRGFVLVGYGQKSKMLDQAHAESLIGLELKLKM